MLDRYNDSFYASILFTLQQSAMLADTNILFFLDIIAMMIAADLSNRSSSPLSHKMLGLRNRSHPAV